MDIGFDCSYSRQQPLKRPEQKPSMNLDKEQRYQLMPCPCFKVQTLTSTALLVLSWILYASGQDSAVNITSADDHGRPGIEEEILGPLRVWHVVFIVLSILLCILVVVCCCLDIRVPRTRQEIENNYQRRLINEKYLRALERTPDQLIQEHRDQVAAENHRLETISELVNPQTLPKMVFPGNRMKKVVEMARKGTGAGKGTADIGDSTNERPIKGGLPLPVNLRDILATMAQQKRND